MNSRLLSFMIAASFLCSPTAMRADEEVLPGGGFDASHYEALWTQSPFTVASPETVATSTDYSLVGLTEVEGVSYASLIDKQSQEHFLLSTDKPVRNLTLVSVTSGHDPANSMAVIKKGDGESITLKLEAPPDSANPMPNMAGGPAGMPNQPGIPNQPGMPMNGVGQPNQFPGNVPPQPRFHRTMIHVPPRGFAPGQGQAPIPPPPPPPR